MHALKRSEETPCVYCHLDEPEEDEDEEFVGLRELKIFPEPRSSGDDMQEEDSPRMSSPSCFLLIHPDLPIVYSSEYHL